MKEIIKKLDKIVFHDAPVKSFNIIYDPKQTIELSLLFYNQGTKVYDDMKIVFNGIQAFEMSNVSLDEATDMDLYSFEYKFEETFVAKLIFNLGVGKAVVVIELVCSELALN